MGPGSATSQLGVSPLVLESNSPTRWFWGFDSPINPGTANRTRLFGRPVTSGVTTTGVAPLLPVNSKVEPTDNWFVVASSATENRNPLPVVESCAIAYR